MLVTRALGRICRREAASAELNPSRVKVPHPLLHVIAEYLVRERLAKNPRVVAGLKGRWILKKTPISEKCSYLLLDRFKIPAVARLV